MAVVFQAFFNFCNDVLLNKFLQSVLSLALKAEILQCRSRFTEYLFDEMKIQSKDF